MTSGPPKHNIPDSAHEEPSRGCPYTVCVRVQPLPPHTLHHSSAIRLHTSSFLQLFIHHTYGHTFPITQKASEPKVHEVSRYSRIVRTIELSHFSLIFLVPIVLDGFPIKFFSCPVCRHVIATMDFDLKVVVPLFKC